MKAEIPLSRFRILVLLALGGLACWSLLWGGKHALGDSADLGRRIEEMALFRQGLDPYVDPDATYPPSAWLVFGGLIPNWSERAVRVLWLVVNLGALGALGEGVRRWMPEGRSGFWTAAVLLTLAASKPVRAGIALGQFHLIPSALAVWAVVLARSGKPLLGGVLLGVALVKPTMVLPLLLLAVVQNRRSVVISASAVQAALWLGASAWLKRSPVGLLSEWVRNARLQEAAGTIDLPTLLTRWGLDGVVPSNLATLILLAVAAVIFWRFRKVDETGLASLAMVISSLFVYHRHYDLVLLLPALAWLASRKGWSWRRALSMGLALFLIVPVHIGPMRGLEAIYDLVFVSISYAFALALILELEGEAAIGRSGRAGFSPPLRSSTGEAG